VEYLKLIPEMDQDTINQRLIFLVESLAQSARAFSENIGESPTNTHNYTSGGRKPAPDYLKNMLLHYRNINAHWLMTGEGEAFKEEEAPAQNQTNISGNRNNVASGKNGKAIQKNYGLSECEKERDALRAQLDKAQREIELLIGQLQMQETIIKSKDEMLVMLRDGSNRPN
jgi:hypothetical protein